jgi:hypothetical protein
VELDPTNPVLVLCATGMAAGGDSAVAVDCFARAWAARTDDFEAAVAAHYVARAQLTKGEKLVWDARAAAHAEAARAAGDRRVDGLMASLYLNLGDSLLAEGRRAEARESATLAERALATLPDNGYRLFVAGGIGRLRRRVDQIESSTGLAALGATPESLAHEPPD